MNKKLEIDPIDEALRLIYLESSNETSSKDLERILNSEYSAHLDENKKKTLIDGLYQNLLIPSFGKLLTDVMDANQSSANNLSLKTKLPETLIEELRTDSTITNNVPVMYIKQILEALNIPFEQARKAILKTFELLKSQTSMEDFLGKEYQPAFRKSYYHTRENINKSSNMSESKDLFENEVALNNYLARLKELMVK